MRNYFEDDIIIKTVFDNIKNFAVCGIIFLVVRSAIEKADSLNGLSCLLHWCVGILLLIIASILWSMNMMHGQAKLQEHAIPGLKWILVVFLYQVLTMSLLLYFIGRAFS